MSQGIVQTVAGGVLIAAGILIDIGTLGGGAILGQALITAGAGMILSGVGTLLSAGALQGLSTTLRDPVAPWRIHYGRGKLGGTLIYCNTFGDNDKWMDMVICLTAHPIQSVDALLFDKNRVLFGVNNNTSISPVSILTGNPQEDIIVSSIQRVNNVVMVTLSKDLNPLIDGDQLVIAQLPTTGLVNPLLGYVLSAEGKYPVFHVLHIPVSGPYPFGQVTFQYISGGGAFGPIVNAGHCFTTYSDYDSKVYMEVLDGTQTLGQTFSGMINGTPYDGDVSDLVKPENYGTGNPWGTQCSAPGKCLVMLRLHYSDVYFSNGLPQIGFLIHGKNDILDPRISPTAQVYTENSALCIADYLSNTIYGFKARYGTEIPLTELVTAANISDEQVPLSWPMSSPLLTESRYTMNGGFTLDRRRSEILQNMLTSCGGRLTFIGGQFFIWPASYLGVSSAIAGTEIYSQSIGPIQWRPKVPINQLYNGVKGTYIAAVNSWESSDFPPYAQDTLHGYSNGAPQYDYDENLTIDQGDRRYLDIQLPFTISSATAQRLAKIELMRRRMQGTGTFSLNMFGYTLAPMDVVEMDLPYFGWTGQLLEIQNVRLKIESSSGSGATMGVEIDVQETDPDIYFWSIGEELSPQGYQQSIVPDTLTPSAPTNFLASSENGSIFLIWTEPSDAYVLNGGHVEIEYQFLQSPEGLWISLGRMNPTIATAEIDNLTVGDRYNIRIRAVNAAGVPSAWVLAALLGSSPVTPGPIPVLPPVLWAPGFETPIGGDALFTVPGFGIDQIYPIAADGSSLAELEIYGSAPPPGLGLVFQVRREFVSGVFAQVVAGVLSGSPSVGDGIISFGGSGGTTNQFVGRVLSKIANLNSSSSRVGIADFLVIANDTSGNFTVTPDPLLGGVAPGDLLTLRTSPTSADEVSFTDSLFNNLYNSGLSSHRNSGNLALVIAGTGTGQTPQTVVDNTNTKVTITPGWDVIPDSTSVIVLVESTPQISIPSNTSDSNSQSLVGTIPVDNYRTTVIHVEGYTSDSRGLMGPIQSVPFRELYIWGAQGTRSVVANTSQLPTDGVIRCDATLVTQPASVTLNGGINNSVTSIVVSSGTNVVNGAYIQINAETSNTTEIVLVTLGGGTTSLTVDRAQLSTGASAHSNGATIILPGALVVTLLAISDVPNQSLLIVKVDSSINYILILAAGSDTFTGGGTSAILRDNTSANGIWDAKAVIG